MPPAFSLDSDAFGFGAFNSSFGAVAAVPGTAPAASDARIASACSWMRSGPTTTATTPGITTNTTTTAPTNHFNILFIVVLRPLRYPSVNQPVATRHHESPGNF